MNLGYTTTNPQSGSCGCKGTGSVCDSRKVKLISKVGDQAIIAFDDCSYISAPAELFDTKSICEKPTPISEDCCQNLNERVTALESKQDKDTIFDPSALEARIAALECFKDAVMKGLITVNTASNEPSFKALNVNFTGECTTNADSIGNSIADGISDAN